MNGQDESNPALIGYLRGQDGPILPTSDYPQCPTRTESHIINPVLTKLVRSRRLDIGLVLFCVYRP